MVLDIQQALFDYAALDYDTRTFVHEKTQAIHSRLKRTAEDIIAIGQDLRAVKARLGHGQFMPWLQAEFEMSRQTAHDFMRVAERFGNESRNFLHLSVSVLYELAAPSTPDTIIELVETGQIPATIPAIREAKRAALPPLEAAVEDGRDEPAYDASVSLPEGFGLVGGMPFTAPLPDGKPVEIPDSWTLPTELRGEPRRNSDNIPIAVPHISSKNNEWYTPAKYIEAARALMGGIDVDPASNRTANETVQATVFYDSDTNGLCHDWHGRVWLNPPYGRDGGDSNQDIWSQRLREQYEAGITTEAVLLVNAAVDTRWFQRLFDYPVCLTLGRINFSTPEPVANGSTHGSAFVYFGSQIDRFVEIFREFGAVVKRW